MDNNNLLKKRILDIANKAYLSNMYTYTNFLNINELNIFYNMCREIDFIDFSLSGGNQASERKIIEFGSEKSFGYAGNFPISLIKISPLLEKFSDSLSHRDFLGAILNLGIDRSVLGDIIVKDKYGYVYCIDSISEYIINNLTKVKHTTVSCKIVDSNIPEAAPALESISVIAASCRADAVVSSLLNCSRSNVLELFRKNLVFINGKITENNSQLLKPNDILVIRKHGKYIFSDMTGETRKGKAYISLKKYI